MQTRCYACGLKLHDGPPTMEELSSQQASLVGLQEREVLVLDHPHFQGMSFGSFCPECQDLILSLPERAWAHDVVGHIWTQDSRLPWDHPDHFTVVFRCQCGHPLGTSKDTPSSNREFRRHLGLVLSAGRI